jgi:1-acyl-sn-glycerol-3-phosphate acyltransferase
MHLALSTYFKIIKVTGKENIPVQGPIIFVANHPSTLMDPVVIGALIKPQIYFLAAAEFMGKGIVTKIMGSLFNMIPVYRPDTLPNKASKNSDVFEKCYAHLSSNGAILIFPEGSSATEKRLRSLKTGTARIALGTEKNNDVQVQIVPIGLNYTDPHTFQSDVFVSIGKPILTSIPELNDITDEFKRAKALTAIIEKRLKENLIHIEDERLELLFEKIATISKHELQSVAGKKLSIKDRFELSIDIQKGLEFYAKKTS